MRNCFPGPQAHIFKCKGELRLEAENLIFVSPWQTRVVVPLRDISDLSIGQFQMWTTPWVMKYERINFLSVTFSAGGTQRRVYLTPVPPGPAFPSQINAEVARRFEVVQRAVAAITGAMPHTSDPSEVTVRAQACWNRKAGPLMFAPLAAWVVGILNMRTVNSVPPAASAAVFVLTLILCVGLAWFCLGFMRANQALRRGDLDAVTSDEPLDEPVGSLSPTAGSGGGKGRRPFWWTISAWAFLLIGIVAVIDTLASLYARPFTLALYPGLAHLFAGVALLTLSRAWRVVALIALTAASAAGLLIGAAMVIAPEHGLVSLPLLGMNIPLSQEPHLGAAAAVALTLVFVWPWYMLLSATGRRLFARHSGDPA